MFGPDKFKEIMPLRFNLGPAARTRRSGAGVCEVEGSRFVLDAEADSEYRDRCVAAGSVFTG